MMEEEEVNPEFLRGFNEGYFLEKNAPQELHNILVARLGDKNLIDKAYQPGLEKELNLSERFQGIIAGQKQAKSETPGQSHGNPIGRPMARGLEDMDLESSTTQSWQIDIPSRINDDFNEMPILPRSARLVERQRPSEDDDEFSKRKRDIDEIIRNTDDEITRKFEIDKKRKNENNDLEP